jgi:hypothetical protein
MKQAGYDVINRMGRIEYPAINISEVVSQARASVMGKSFEAAIYAFANVYHCTKKDIIHERAIQVLRSSPLHSMTTTTRYSKDGRIIAQLPGFTLGDISSKEYNNAVWSKMVEYYELEVNFAVHGRIYPALQVLTLEHRIPKSFCEALAWNSPIVPLDRAELVGKALSAGFDHDFTVGLHLLVPQIENMVRIALTAAGIRTTNIQDGIENENGLSTLMLDPSVDNIIGVDLAFELRALFCDPFGPNLRNEIAHGLLDDEECQSDLAVYAWWFGLKLVFNALWKSTVRYDAGQEKKDSE